MEILINCMFAWDVAGRVLRHPDLPYSIRLELVRELDDASGNQCNFHLIEGYENYGHV